MKLVLELRLVYRLTLKLEAVLWLGSSLGQEMELPVCDRICLGLYLSFIVDTIAKVPHFHLALPPLAFTKVFITSEVIHINYIISRSFI